MDLREDDTSPLKRYKSDPSLFKMRGAPVAQGQSPQSDHSENQPTSYKPVRRHLVARRLSASNLSPRTIFRIPSRLDQIKFEESVDKCIVEAAHEKEIQSAINMSKSWEHLCLSDTEPMMVDGQKGPPSTENTSFLLQSSSPARACISPLAMFSTNSSPSYSTSRASPNMVKHTLNLAKRKLNIGESVFSPAKKILLSPSVFQSISLGITKPTSEDSQMEEMRSSSSFMLSQNSSSSSPLICYSDGSSSPSLDSSQSLSFQTGLSLAGGDITTSGTFPATS